MIHRWNIGNESEGYEKEMLYMDTETSFFC